MAAIPRITLQLDYPRTEILREGWGTTKNAEAFTFTKLQGGKYDRTAIPADVWREPNTGCLMKRPRSDSRGFEENPIYFPDRYGIAEFDVAKSDDNITSLFVATHPAMGGRILSQRLNPDNPFVQLVEDGVFQNVLSTANAGELGWAMRTKTPLRANEGFGATFVPRGTSSVSADPFFGAAYGRYYYLECDLRGIATMYENIGSVPDPEDPDAPVGPPEWVEREVFNFGQGGVNHAQPFEVSVIPFGGRYICVRFSQAYKKGGRAGSLRLGGQEHWTVASWLFDVTKYGRTPSFDPVAGLTVITQPDKLRLAFRKTKYAYDWKPFRIRYATADTVVHMGLENIGYPRPAYDPVVTPNFITPAGSAVLSGFTNHENDAWTKELDTKLVPKFTLRSSVLDENGQHVYSPELWNYTALIETESYTPPYTIDDASPDWTYIRLQRTNRNDWSEVTVKLRNESRFARMMRRGSPFRILSDGVMLAECYTKRTNPTLAGVQSRLGTSTTPQAGNFTLEEELDAWDMWERLNTTPLMATPTLANAKLGPTVSEWIRRAGFGEVQVAVMDPEINEIDIEGYDDAQLKNANTLNGDTMIGDAIREVLRKFTVQDRSLIRVRWKRLPNPVEHNGVFYHARWEIDWVPVYDPADPLPSIIFYLDTDLPLPDGTTWSHMSDEGRLIIPPVSPGSGFSPLVITSTLDLTINSPECNALKCTVAKDYEEGASALETYIAPHPDVLENPDAQIFEGRLRSGQKGPPEITAKDQNSLERQARTLYDAMNRHTVVAQTKAEWQPYIDADLFVLIVGRDDHGLPCCFGVFQIDDVDAQIDADADPSDPLERDWSYLWQADYKMSYVGHPFDADFNDAFPPFSYTVPPLTY